jgi:peptidoglycan hydrolase CwlO-like protein
MSLFAKIMVIVNLVLAVMFLAAAGTLHGAAESYKKQFTTVKASSEAEISKLNSQISTKDKEIENKGAEQKASELRATAAEATQKTLNEGNAALMSENHRLRAEMEKLQASLGDLAKSVQDQAGLIKDQSDKLATSDAERKAALDENSSLKENLARETARAEDAEKSVAAGEEKAKKMADELDRLGTQVTAYVKTFGPLGAPYTQKAVNGVVSAADAKSDVYVVNVGSEDGVAMGYEFTVFRGSEYVSTIVIDTVYPKYSCGRTRPGSKKSDVKNGDSVATKL